MAQLFGEVTIKVTPEMTAEGRRVIRATVAEVLPGAMEDAGVIVFASQGALAEFVREEVRKALNEQARSIRLQSGMRL